MAKLLTTRKAAAARNVREATVRRWIRKHGLRALLVGSSYAIDADDLAAFEAPLGGRPAGRAYSPRTPRPANVEVL